MEDLAEGLGRTVLRMLLGFVRMLWFVAWELLFEFVGCAVGWSVCRTLSFGRWPEQGISEQDQASWPVAIGVELLGLATLAGLLYALSGLVG